MTLFFFTSHSFTRPFKKIVTQPQAPSTELWVQEHYDTALPYNSYATDLVLNRRKKTHFGLCKSKTKEK